MAIKDRPTNVIDLPSCHKCHEDKTIRMIHLLRMQDNGKSDEELRSHLQTQFPRWSKDDLSSELNWMHAIGRLWSQKAIDEKIPLWMAWMEAHGFDISRTSTGWRMSKNIYRLA